MLTARYGALGHEFAFDVPSAPVAAFLERALAPMRLAGEARSRWRVVDRGLGADPRFDIHTPFGATFHVEREEDLPILLLWHVNRVICFRTTDHLMAHAGAVARDGRAVLLPAVAEAGKSTLTAGLVRAGMDYLSDEAAALTPDGDVDPYPKAIALDPGSWAALPDLRPALDADLEPYAARQWHVDPNAIRPGSIAGRCRPALVVAPRYEPGAPAEVEAVSAAEGVRVLAQESFNLRQWGRPGLELLAGVARGCRCYRLRHGNLDDAVATVLGLLDDS